GPQAFGPFGVLTPAKVGGKQFVEVRGGSAPRQCSPVAIRVQSCRLEIDHFRDSSGGTGLESSQKLFIGAPEGGLAQSMCRFTSSQEVRVSVAIEATPALEPAAGARRHRLAFWKSPDGQPPWARPALLGIAAFAAFLYAWHITDAGLAPFYS